jgi:hypothetical protein
VSGRVGNNALPVSQPDPTLYSPGRPHLYLPRIPILVAFVTDDSRCNVRNVDYHNTAAGI